MDIRDKLKSYRKKTITREQLNEMIRPDSNRDLYDRVTKAVSDGVLEPVKASGRDGNRRYPLYMKYRIITSEDYSEVIREISKLHPALQKNGYLQRRPAAYIEQKEAILKLNKYFFKGQSEVDVSKKERSFDIFDEEKQLEDKSLRALLDKLELGPEVLRYYETPEYCFNDYIPQRKHKMLLLICENKDIWFNIRRRMYEDRADEIFGKHIDGVVYGCGNRVSQKDALQAYTDFLGAEEVDYLYWGDIDRSGFDIFISLRKNSPDLRLMLFTEAYSEMVRLAEDRVIPESDDHRKHDNNYSEILDRFTGNTRSAIFEYIKDNKRVPQEIISYERLLTCMKQSNR